MNPNRSTVLILSSDPAFSRAVTEHWPDAPAADFVVLKEDLLRELQRDTYDLAIADVSSEARSEALTAALSCNQKPAILIAAAPCSGHAVPGLQPNVIRLRRAPSWEEFAGHLGSEILRRCQAELRAREAERSCDAAKAEAMLGRYMAEMRHTVNNALTSVLGNAELLQLEPGLPATVMAQADTIRNMALRLHEVFQRFSSIEKELSAVARESGKHTAFSRSASF